jgi:stage II sporulation protein GA (sporulation sigma-E factor processing peptidase)
LQEIKIYLDQPLVGGIISWIQDAILLWMVAQISGFKVKRNRFILGGAVGGVFQFLVLTNLVSNGLLYPWILAPVIFILIVPILMAGLTFTPSHIKNYIRILGYMYLLSFLLAGFHWGIDIINQRFFHWNITLWWRFLMHLSLILTMGELGWGIVHRKFWEQICLYPIQISWGGQMMQLNALLDTGNQLHDPITKVPVVIVELQQIKDQLPLEFIKWVENIQLGELGLNIELSDFWEERVRILPFNSLGKEHGLMVGFRSDQVKVWQKQQTVINENVVIGLYNKSLSREGAFHALIPPAVLRN